MKGRPRVIVTNCHLIVVNNEFYNIRDDAYFSDTPSNNDRYYILYIPLQWFAFTLHYITLPRFTFQAGSPPGPNRAISVWRPCFFPPVIMGNITAQYFLTDSWCYHTRSAEQFQPSAALRCFTTFCQSWKNSFSPQTGWLICQRFNCRDRGRSQQRLSSEETNSTTISVELQRILQFVWLVTKLFTQQHFWSNICIESFQCLHHSNNKTGSAYICVHPHFRAFLCSCSNTNSNLPNHNHTDMHLYSTTKQDKQK